MTSTEEDELLASTWLDGVLDRIADQDAHIRFLLQYIKDDLGHPMPDGFTFPNGDHYEVD